MFKCLKEQREGAEDCTLGSQGRAHSIDGAENSVGVEDVATWRPEKGVAGKGWET